VSIIPVHRSFMKDKRVSQPRLVALGRSTRSQTKAVIISFTRLEMLQAASPHL
jgi:hypothetical protein